MAVYLPNVSIQKQEGVKSTSSYKTKKIKDILTFFPGKNTLRSLKGTTRLRECSSLSPQNFGIFLLNTFY